MSFFPPLQINACAGAGMSHPARVLVSATAIGTKEVVPFAHAGVVGPFYPTSRADQTPAPKHYKTMNHLQTPAPMVYGKGCMHAHVSVTTASERETRTSKRYSPALGDEGNSRLIAWVVSGPESY
ncbi:hypothetical protein HNP33_002539 [Comamonas odontotermitis]|uniref:Uncharacterized protein n=1 Tax=Comamonas odontotermitis TaxID=379895 RepID=A0ABR6RH11_9BURK|nr:hypothetical protein [Comamonas odontotermitis]